jgi:sugar lactone lactonase YvrE
VRAFGSVPMPPADQGYLFGLARSATGELFAGVASVSEAYRAGIYRLPASGGSATLFASHPELRFPNGLTFDVSGRLYVTDSLSGALFSIDGAGGTTLWLRDPSLLGDVGAPCANGAPFPIGANGVAWFEDRLYVVNSDHGTLLRIALQRDGSPGPIETMLGPDCTTLGGADGLAVDDEGTLFVAANARDAIVRIAPSGAARTIATGFDFPASVALDSATLFVTNAALKSARTQGAQPTPGLLRVPIAPP